MQRRLNERSGSVEANVTRITADLTLTAPPGCRASVLLKLVGNDTEAMTRSYVWWVVAGRDDFDAVAVEVRTEGDILRIDVPENQPLSTQYLQQVLNAWKDPKLPPDTPVVKGVQ
jgi:hypothetical protein